MSFWGSFTLAKTDKECMIDLERVIAMWPSTIITEEFDEDHNPIRKECTVVRQVAGATTLDWSVNEPVEDIRQLLITYNTGVAG